MFKEDDIIKIAESSSRGFIGDDAAVLPSFNSKQYIITKDLLLEDIHFRTSYFSPYNLAHKAIHANLSDLASMAAKPCYIMCGISIPHKLQDYAKEFMNQLVAVCKKEDIILIGGDTTSSVDKLVISITAIGFAELDKIKYRNYAVDKSLICTIGNLGYANLGFKALENNNVEINQEFLDAFLLPIAKIKEGEWLGKDSRVLSMMDISDGLFIDLKRMCQSSNLGAEIELDNFTFSDSYLDACLRLKLDPLNVALTGGEDYGLLFAVSDIDYNELADEFLYNFNHKIKVLGRFNLSNKVTFIKNKNNRKIINLDLQPFTHFGEKL